MKMGAKKLMVCTMGSGRQNCETVMAKPCITMIIFLLKMFLKLTSYLQSRLILQYRAIRKLSTTETIPLMRLVSMVCILLSLAQMKAKGKRICEAPKRTKDILSAPNFSTKSGIILACGQYNSQIWKRGNKKGEEGGHEKQIAGKERVGQMDRQTRVSHYRTTLLFGYYFVCVDNFSCYFCCICLCKGNQGKREVGNGLDGVNLVNGYKVGVRWEFLLGWGWIRKGQY